MSLLPEKSSNILPLGLVRDKLPFVPNMVMTAEIEAVTSKVMNHWRNRKHFDGLAQFGIRPIDRILFYGPPGNGKTMACYWIARELKMPVYRVLCDQLHGSYVGQTTRAVADVLKFFSARTDPALLLWDEVEAIFIDRKGATGDAAHEYSAATTVFLQSLDRWKAPTLMVLATNLPEKLDAALLSRVEARLLFPGPTPSQCEQMLQYWSELLHAHGGEEWGPAIAERIKDDPPVSFRELHQHWPCW